MLRCRNRWILNVFNVFSIVIMVLCAIIFVPFQTLNLFRFLSLCLLLTGKQIKLPENSMQFYLCSHVVISENPHVFLRYFRPSSGHLFHLSPTDEIKRECSCDLPEKNFQCSIVIDFIAKIIPPKNWAKFNFFNIWVNWQTARTTVIWQSKCYKKETEVQSPSSANAWYFTKNFRSIGLDE